MADIDRRAHTEALAAIEGRLDKLAVLGGLVQLTLGGPQDSSADAPVVLVDARLEGAARLLLCDDGGWKGDAPDCVARMHPALITGLQSGNVDIRASAMDPSRIVTTGDQSLLIRFGDILAQTPFELPTTFTAAQERSILPRITEDLEQVRRDLKDWGYAFVGNALRPAELAALRARNWEQAAAEVELGVAMRDGGPGLPNQRMFNLVSKGDEYAALLEHRLITELCPEVLGDGYQLMSYTSNIARPGSQAMILHTDQLGIQPPIRHFPLGLNFMWFLTDVTETNGGTRVFPGSHKGNIAPSDLHDVAGTVTATGPAGTCMIFESRLWHATGPNVDATGERPVVISFFVRSFLRTQENWYLSVPPATFEKLSPHVQGVLGYKRIHGLGYVSGGFEDQGKLTPVGAIATRPKSYIGRLTPSAPLVA